MADKRHRHNWFRPEGKVETKEGEAFLKTQSVESTQSIESIGPDAVLRQSSITEHYGS